MSSDETPNVPAGRNSREAVREKAQQVHAKQSRARLMRRIIIAVVAIVAIGSVGTAVALAVSSSLSQPTMTPRGMDADGVTVTDVAIAETADEPIETPAPTEAGTTASPTPEPTAEEGTIDIHIYVDYLSTGAAEFEAANARQLAGWINEGAVTVTYHPVALLTANSNGTKYSLRAAAAAACVATYSPAQFFDYNHELLSAQPAADSDGHSDADLADLAIAVGVEDGAKVRSCIEDQDFVSWAKDATARALEGPLPGTDDLKLNGSPMILVDGEVYVGSMKDASEFSQFVLTTASEAYFGTPTPTPTPEGTATPKATETPKK